MRRYAKDRLASLKFFMFYLIKLRLVLNNFVNSFFHSMILLIKTVKETTKELNTAQQYSTIPKIKNQQRKQLNCVYKT